MNISARYREAALWLILGMGTVTAWATVPETTSDLTVPDPTEVQTAATIAEHASGQPGHGWHSRGLATWYGKRFHGKKTASGERFDRHAMTAAHPRLPMGAWLRVVNPRNGRHVHVRINDRGPVSRRFILDLSEAAAERLGFRHQGAALVEVYRSAKPHSASDQNPDFDLHQK